MSSRVAAPARIDYPKHWFVIGLTGYVPVVGVLAFLAYGTVETFWRGFWVASCAAIGILFFLFLVPPLFTAHLAGDKGLRLRMGLLLNTVVPYAWIQDVRETHVSRGGISVGIGVKYAGRMGTLFVTSSFSDLVALRLNGDHRLGGNLRPPVSQVVLSVSDKDAFMRLVRERAVLEEGA